MRSILVLALVLVWLGSASADPHVLAETPLGSDRCAVVGTTKTDHGGEPLKESQWYASEWRCEGYQGRFLYLAYDDEREGLAFGTAQSASTEYMWAPGFGSWGPSVEWRGPPADGTAQTTLAAIARYSWNIQMGAGERPPSVGADLAVIRVGKGQEDTCIVAWVDTSANQDAIDLARRRADAALSQNVCEAGKQPERLGKLGPRLTE